MSVKDEVMTKYGADEAHARLHTEDVILKPYCRELYKLYQAYMNTGETC